MTRDEILAIFTDLSYVGYYHKRRTNSADRLARIFPQAEAFERRYQEEIHSGGSPEAA